MLVGWAIQAQLPADPTVGADFSDGPQAAVVTAIASDGPSEGKLVVGERVVAITRHRDVEGKESTTIIRRGADVAAVLATTRTGEAIWLLVEGEDEPRAVIVDMSPESERALFIRPFDFVAELFLALLKMLIVPIILTSIITGVSGAGSGKDLRRLGIKTFGYYIATSVLAIALGLVLVNLIQPGEGAALGLRPSNSFEGVAQQSFVDILRRMVPENLFTALADNRQMLQVIFFALLFGFFITQTENPHRDRMRNFFQSAFEVMLKLAAFVLSLIPIGVFALIVRVVGKTGFGLFESLLWYMVTVALGLVLHSFVTLPLLLKFVGRVSPLAWAKAMSPALLTAFSTSSSAITLPASLESVEKRGKVSNRVTSFVLPMGATINMDGTALYECAGVIFLAQYYAGISDFELTMASQMFVVVMALLASIGAAGIPSAGIVMMLTILSALDLPIEGAALILAVDRPLDMMRTMVNVWSDSCGAAIVARSEGETGLAGDPVVPAAAGGP